MKIKYLLMVTIILFALSCNSDKNKSKKPNSRELLPHPEKYAQDGYNQLPDSLKPEFKPDTSICGISLYNSNNVEVYLGEDVMKKLNDNDIPNLSVLSKDKKQRLTFYFHPGSIKNEFSEFKIAYGKDKDRTEIVLNDTEFITESGVKLGKTIGSLRMIKGEPDSITNNEQIIFHYRIDNIENSNFLKKYNMPIYYADYIFYNGYLVEFKFGFEYP